jgi:hypothetical protein
MVHEGTDMTLPIVVPMTWHGDPPVISMTGYTIPGLGSFTCRVFFYDGRYAGTWEHDGRGGGHLFGTIERAATTR